MFSLKVSKFTDLSTVKLSVLARNAINNKELPGVLIEHKDAASTDPYDKATTNANGIAILGSYKKGTKVAYKASKTGFIPISDTFDVTRESNDQVQEIALHLNLRPEVCKGYSSLKVLTLF